MKSAMVANFNIIEHPERLGNFPLRKEDVIERAISSMEKKLQIELNQFGKSEYAGYVRNYGYEFVSECLDIAIVQYLKYDDSGRRTDESVDKILMKLGGILYNKYNEKFSNAV